MIPKIGHAPVASPRVHAQFLDFSLHMPYSLTKAPIPIETAQAIVYSHLGNQRRIAGFQELDEGFFSTAYQIDLEDGLRCVLKIAPPDSVKLLRYEKNILQAEVAVMRLARQQAGIPAPEIYSYDPTRSLLEREFFIMQFLPGVPFHKLKPQLGEAEQREIERAIGALTRRMNAITGESFGYFAESQARYASWRECFQDMLAGVLLDGREAGVDLPYSEIAALAQPLYPALDEVTESRLVHWDLWDGNVFVDPQALQVTGLIDFERALWGDPLMEFCFLPFPEGSAYRDGYAQDMLVTPGQQRRRILYNIYLYLIMVIECTYRQYDSDNHQEAWARAQLAGQMERLTRSRLDDLAA